MTVHQPTAPVADLTVASVPVSVGRVRRHAVAACTALGWTGDRDLAELLVSEVTTNALVHGDGEVRVRVRLAGSVLRIEVDDASSTVPRLRTAAADAEGGRGLAMVDALASAWGVEPAPDGRGKTVWFELTAGG